MLVRLLWTTFFAITFAAGFLSAIFFGPDVEVMERSRDIAACEKYAVQAMRIDSMVDGHSEAKNALKEYALNVIALTCIAEANRNLDEEDRKLKEMRSMAEKQIRDKNEAARARNTM